MQKHARGANNEPKTSKKLMRNSQEPSLNVDGRSRNNRGGFGYQEANTTFRGRDFQTEQHLHRILVDKRSEVTHQTLEDTETIHYNGTQDRIHREGPVIWEEQEGNDKRLPSESLEEILVKVD